MTARFDELRVLIVGASSGIGRATAECLLANGARVALLARRRDELDKLASNYAPGVVTTIPCDVRNEEELRGGVRTAIEAFSGLDAVFYSAGISPLALVVDMTAEQWRSVFEVNVFGLAIVVSEAAAELTCSRGRVVAMSTYAITNPKAGLIPYVASKAALVKMMQGLRVEHRDVAFSVVEVAHTDGTEFRRDFDPTTYESMMQRWMSESDFAYAPMMVDDVGAKIAEVLTAPMVIEHVVLVGPKA